MLAPHVSRSGGFLSMVRRSLPTAILGSLSVTVIAAWGSGCSSSPPAKEATGDSSQSVATCHPPLAKPAYRLTDALPGVALDRPVTLVTEGSAYFVAEQGGHVKRITLDEVGGWTSELYIDLSDRLAPEAEGEGGLLGFSLSPDFASTGEMFVVYTGKSETALFRTVVARLSRSNGTYTDMNSEEVLLELDRDVPFHNGGHLAFGPDRLLYISIGDSSWGDPNRRAQDPNELFGKILRIDVLDATRPYRVPDDNPFANGDGRPEVYALGFRNPWRFSFDAQQRLWVGDVGHHRWEEINLVVKGGNYGWPHREGKHCFPFHDSCEAPGAIDPVHEYPHVDGFSVTGGLVYRGKKLAKLAGSYIFGDFMTGRIWALDASAPGDSRLLLDSGAYVVSFAEDADGELLVLDHFGRILQLEPTGTDDVAPAGNGPAVSLRQLGCLDEREGYAGEMNPGLVPYEINAQFWSDGLDKRRWFALPPESKIHVGDEGWDLPPGSMLLKELSSAGRRIETRMLVRDAELGWLGYTFEWNATQSDAVLLEDEKTIDIDGSPWTLPSRAQCFACHRGSNRVIGFQASQLNRDTVHANHGNQLEAFSTLGIFDRAVDPHATPRLTDPYDDTAPVELRARSWLHTNCSFCHNASIDPTVMDLRAFIPTSKMNALCHESGDLDVDVRTRIVPGQPDNSAVVFRIGSPNDLRMPPLGSARVDVAGVDVVSQWVSTLDSCF